MTSIKTYDWNTSARVGKPENLESMIKGYVDDLHNFDGNMKYKDSQNNTRIETSNYPTRVLSVVVPATGGTPAQLAALNRAIAYGRENNVVVRVYRGR